MQSTASPSLSAMQAAMCPTSASVPPATLLEAFATIPDPRSAAWTRYPLPAILALSVTALLANHLSVLAIAEWGAAQSREILAALGFAQGITPHQTTLQRLFGRLDPAPLAEALRLVLAPPTTPTTTDAEAPADATTDHPAAPQAGVAIDGKALRGRLVGQDATPQSVHTVTLCAHQTGVVLAQVPVEATTEAVQTELSVAATLLARLDWRGRLLTGDALYCQRHLAQQVTASGGDYLFTVKANQPTLHEAIALLFDPPPERPSLASPTDWRQARQVSKGHGRLEVRTLTASTDLADYLDWPGLRQVLRYERVWQAAGQTKRAVRYGITSLTPKQAPPAQLLVWRRGHWTIENRLHYVCDVTFREDASRIRCGHGPIVVAWLRRLALSLLRQAGHHAIAARLRYHSSHPEAALALLGLAPLPNRA